MVRVQRNDYRDKELGWVTAPGLSRSLVELPQWVAGRMGILSHAGVFRASLTGESTCVT
jgi:hypothetical protein